MLIEFKENRRKYNESFNLFKIESLKYYCSICINILSLGINGLLPLARPILKPASLFLSTRAYRGRDTRSRARRPHARDLTVAGVRAAGIAVLAKRTTGNPPGGKRKAGEQGKEGKLVYGRKKRSTDTDFL